MEGEATCIRLWDCLLVPLQGDVSDDRAEGVVTEVLRRIRDEECANVLLDLSGVGTLDSHLCATLVALARSARMMGAQTVVSGMRPEIAMTLETMGVRLQGMTTVATLEDALGRLGIRRASDQRARERAEGADLLRKLLDQAPFTGRPTNDHTTNEEMGAKP